MENSAVATGLEKVSFHSNSKEGQCQTMFQLVHNYNHLTYQQNHVQNSPVRLQQYVNGELPDVQAGFRKGRGTRDQIAQRPLDHRKSKRISEKHLLLLH